MTKPCVTALAALFLVAGCSSSTSPSPATSDAGPADSGPSPGGAACQTLPAGFTATPAACTSKPGLWSALTVDKNKKSYSVVCDQAESAVYKDQAEFDANEGTSTAPGITIVSNKDYVRTTTCASGSIEYTTPTDPKTTVLFLWTKQP